MKNYSKQKNKIVSLAIFTTVALSSCSYLKASPANSSSFLPHGDLLVEDIKRSPFNGSYYPNRMDFYKKKSTYKYMLVLPVNTTSLEEKIKLSDASDMDKTDMLESLEETKRYFSMKLKDAFKEYKNHPVKIVRSTDQDGPVLSIEIAITELVPTKAAANFLTTVAGAFIPGTGLIKSFTKGSIAFEAIVKDAKTGEIFVECKDREADKSSIFTFRDFDEFAHQRKIIDEWSEEFAALAATDDNVMVDGASPFTFNPF